MISECMTNSKSKQIVGGILFLIISIIFFWIGFISLGILLFIGALFRLILLLFNKKMTLHSEKTVDSLFIILFIAFIIRYYLSGKTINLFDVICIGIILIFYYFYLKLLMKHLSGKIKEESKISVKGLIGICMTIMGVAFLIITILTLFYYPDAPARLAFIGTTTLFLVSGLILIYLNYRDSKYGENVSLSQQKKS